MSLPLFTCIMIHWNMDVNGRSNSPTVNIILYLLWIQEDKNAVHGLDKDVFFHSISFHRSWTRLHRYHSSSPFVVSIIHHIQVRFDRISRVYYINSRWKGPIIYSLLFCDENPSELYSFFEEPFEERITFIVYMCALEKEEPFINYNHTHFVKTSGHPYLYPFNVLRSLGIEYIQTTHYLLLDCDILISGNVPTSSSL